MKKRKTIILPLCAEPGFHELKTQAVSISSV